MIRILVGDVERSFPALPVTIGRDADNDLPVDDVKLSRHHCRVVRTPEGIVLEDLESRNGTFVNGAPTRRHVLRAGDAILIGVTPLSVEWDPESAPPPRAKRRAPRDLEELEAENERLRQLLALTKSLASERDEEALLERIVDSAVALTGAERGFLFLVTVNGLDFKVARDAAGSRIESPSEKISRSIAREAVESGRPVVTEDAGGDSRFAGGRSVAFLRLRSVLCVPLKVPDGPLGALYLEHRAATSQFHPRDVPIAASFGDFAAVALATARHVSDLRRSEEQLRESRERIARLNARLRGLLRRKSEELAGVRADLDMSRQELGLRYDYAAIVGQSAAMRNALALLDRVMDGDLPVVLQGESGTGKELLARALHYNGPRRQAAFVTVNCAAIPKDLIEAELFGREEGAYTGATSAREGLFEQADKGTLFLDEIGEMALELQGKLLRVLETGEVRRLGGEAARKVSVRVIAASNRDLLELSRAAGFREDLYYRLNGVTCRIPPLRERAEDIPALFDHFLDALCAEGGVERPHVDPEVIDRLQAYPWPGNVRELRNEAQRLLALQRGQITPDLLSLNVYSGDPSAVPPSHLPPGGIRELVEKLERRVLLDTLRRVNGNKTRAASLLGLSRLGLRKKLDRYGLSDKS
ncbi:MAG: sigma 54-interacting transcriptional regulator [Planctomycetota bacterium]